MLAAAIAIGAAAVVHGEDARKTGPEWVREGNRLLQEKEYAKALDAYDQAQIALPESAKINYNRGIALYELGRYDEAQTALQNALRPDAIELEPDIKYNLGRSEQAAAMQTNGDMQKALDHTSRAIEFYNDALQLRPDDADTKKNLNIAETQQKFLKKLIELARQQQQPQQDQSKKNDSEKDDQEKEDQQEKQDQQQQNSDGDKQDQQQPSDSKQGDDKQEQQGQESESESGKQDKSGDPSDKSDKDADSKEQQGEQKPPEQSPESGDQQDEQENKQDGRQDQRTDEQLGEDQLKEARAKAAQEKKNAENAEDEHKDQDASDKKDEQEMQAAQATSQSATSMPAETPLEMAKRISIDKANQLLQQARDNEARRREALREARLRQQGRANVDKDW